MSFLLTGFLCCKKRPRRRPRGIQKAFLRAYKIIWVKFIHFSWEIFILSKVHGSLTGWVLKRHWFLHRRNGALKWDPANAWQKSKPRKKRGNMIRIWSFTLIIKIIRGLNK